MTQRNTHEYFRKRAGRSNRQEAISILNRAGKGNRPVAGDELPDQEQIMEKKPSRKVSGVAARRLKKRVRSS